MPKPFPGRRDLAHRFYVIARPAGRGGWFVKDRRDATKEIGPTPDQGKAERLARRMNARHPAEKETGQ